MMQCPWVEATEVPLQTGEKICDSCWLAVWSGLGFCPVCDFYGPPADRGGVTSADPDADEADGPRGS